MSEFAKIEPFSGGPVRLGEKGGGISRGCRAGHWRGMEGAKSGTGAGIDDVTGSAGAVLHKGASQADAMQMKGKRARKTGGSKMGAV